MWDYITKIAECAVALAGLILGFLSVKLSRLSFREAKLAREDIAKFGFRKEQEKVVAELVKYINRQDIGFYNKLTEIFKGNIWEVAETKKLDGYKDYEIRRFVGNFTLLKVDEFLYNVYLPKDIALVLRYFQMRQGSDEPTYGENVLKIRTSFHIVMDEDYMEEEATFDSFYLDKEIRTVSGFIQMANQLKEAVTKWYRENGILETCNIFPIDNTGNGPSVMGMFRENE